MSQFWSDLFMTFGIMAGCIACGAIINWWWMRIGGGGDE